MISNENLGVLNKNIEIFERKIETFEQNRYFKRKIVISNKNLGFLKEKLKA